jgi:2-polyprenyl-3-methyl-5-hydroxy-6-metoxy-1,4-benzoquinol methylase
MDRSTDSVFSIATDEFLWSSEKGTEAHRYLFPPTIRTLRKVSARSVLDMGCGNGSLAALLDSQGFTVAGCDASISGLALARRSHPNVNFFDYDVMESLPSEHNGRYDAVVSLEVIEHLLLPRRLLKSAYDALRPGGVLIVSTPFHGYFKNIALALTNSFDKHWHPLRDFGHVKFFSRKTLSALVIESGFSVSTIMRVGRIPTLACSMILVATKLK